ncbi:uncharacterized protein Dvar_80490 [Desulfosarcina variabilis str. Montpellier]|uniref:hypothetical protein n=1 Tax=Desulfosarcina variabilis TaxID=2300 RepID=UPI003AFAD190
MSVRVQINAICFEADSEKDNSKPKKKGKKMSKTVKLVVVFMNVREVVQTNCKGEYSMPAYEGI